MARPYSPRTERRLGTVDEVLGSDADDIFHGVRVGDAATPPRRDGRGRADHELTARRITTDLSAAEPRSLPDYDEAASYHLASVGRFRKHLGWVKDSKRDEEPG